MTEPMEIYEDAANVAVAEADAFETNIEAFRAAVEETAAFAFADAVEAAAGYKIVDLRGRFTSSRGNWGTSGKDLGCILHYNGPATPASAQTDPIAWIRMINGLHDDVGRFSPGWYFDGFAYNEMIVGDTVYWVRDYAAKLPHCGNTTYNARALGIYIPIGGSQKATDLTLRTAFARMEDHNDVMRKGRDAVKPHSAVGASSCCGDPLRAEIRKYVSGGSPGGSAPAPKPSDPKPAPTPAPSGNRVVLLEDVKKDRQVFFGSAAGAERAVQTLKDYGIRAGVQGKA